MSEKENEKNEKVDQKVSSFLGVVLSPCYPPAGRTGVCMGAAREQYHAHFQGLCTHYLMTRTMPLTWILLAETYW